MQYRKRLQGRPSPRALRVSPQTFALHLMKLADTFIDPQAGALLAQDAIAEWLDRYRLELDCESETVIYESILETLKRADLVQLK